jgi:hypothetical protein
MAQFWRGTVMDGFDTPEIGVLVNPVAIDFVMGLPL